MRFALVARLAARELRGGLRGFRIFLGCVILGVAAIAAIGTLRESIDAGLKRDGARLLGGDAEIILTYRFASAAEHAWMAGVARRVSEIADFRSMAVAPDGARALTQVKAVDSAYPLVGRVRLAPDIGLEAALAGAEGLPGAVMHPVLAARLGLKPGDELRLGGESFRLMATLEDEPDMVLAGFGLGPRTIVALAALRGTDLLRPGTLYSTHYRLDLPPGAEPARLKAQAEEALSGSGMRWRDARNGAPGIARFVSRLSAFLVLVGLSGLAVGGIGISTALRAWLAGKTRTIAILRSLGADQRTVFLCYFLQVGVMAALGIVLGLALGTGAVLAASPVIAAHLPVPAVFAPWPGPMAEAATYSALTVLIFTLWPLARTGQVRAAALWRGALSKSRHLPPLPFLAAQAGLIALMVAAAAWFSGETRLSLWTAGAIGAALVALALAAFAIRAAARALRPAARGRPALGWALAMIAAPGSSATPVVLSLGLGLSVLAALGQIDANLRGAIVRDLPARAPAFFFLDIQKSQLPGFLKRLQDDPGVSRIDKAPMLRGIITAINGRPAREVAGDHWVLRGDRAVTYAATLPARSTLTAGKWWPPSYDGPPQISFAADEAAEMGLKLGDTITVNILGREITARLTSFRKVDFSTAGMGFIMVMNPAALSAAPHSFIASVYAKEAARAAILRDITDSFPNITAIPVADAIARLNALLGGLAQATAWGAAASLLTGFLVLIGAAAADQRARRFEAAILKTLGATRARLLAGLALRAGLLGAAAGLVALGAGIGGGWAVSRFVMETGFTLAWGPALGIVLSGAAVSLLAGLAFAWGPMRARPARVLRAPE